MQNEPSNEDQAQFDILQRSVANKLEIMKQKQERGEPITSDDKIKVAVLADSPTVVTGFGNVCREVLDSIYKTGAYDFEVVGINYDGSPHNLPYRIWPAVNGLIADAAYREPYGRQKFLDVIGSGRFDLVWVLQDSFIVCEELAQRVQETNAALPFNQKFAFMFYFPIDATPKKKWIDGSALHADFPVTYTQYAYDEVMKLYAVDKDSLLKPEEQEKNKADGAALSQKLSVIYHGINTEDFHPIEDKDDISELRQRLWSDDNKDKFVFINVNRNQPRKDLFRTLQAFKILLDRRRAKGKDDVYLYMHCNIFDNGLNLIDMAKQIGLVDGQEFAYPNPAQFGPSQGFPVSMVNEMYNAADAVITTTLGEGWGLSITEAMAVKRPVIAPDHTSITEMLGKTDSGTAERGFLVKTRGEFVQTGDNSRVRPLTDPYDMADKMEFVVENRELIQPIVDRAYEWVTRLTWDGPDIAGKWYQVFAAAYAIGNARRIAAVDELIAEQLKKQGLGRNEICPVCPGEKYKNCRHGKEG